jgi:hypothetical protein
MVLIKTGMSTMETGLLQDLTLVNTSSQLETTVSPRLKEILLGIMAGGSRTNALKLRAM